MLEYLNAHLPSGCTLEVYSKENHELIDTVMTRFSPAAVAVPVGDGQENGQD